MPNLKPCERRAKQRSQSLWRDPASEYPPDNTTVLLRVVSDLADKIIITAAYYGASGWTSAYGSKHINGNKTGWMHLREAVQILNRATRGEVRHG